MRKQKLNVSTVNSTQVSKSFIKDRVENNLLKTQKKARNNLLEALVEKARKKKKC